ncbi:25183_t:CDS:2 [Gigaspora margarita]|uniref:25183_t:CDS:1 n=1 Tax=Gigaspora margarita TaxID=4874 RepID=A0ABM8VWT8_GIGMA|nr:25183_t:CDS:2 [Gigaspora margarita]
MEDIILVAKESNRDNLTKVVIEEKMNIDCQTIFEQKKKTRKYYVSEQEEQQIEHNKIDNHQEMLTQNKEEIVRKSTRNIEDIELSQHQVETEEETEFDKDKEYIQQAVKDKEKEKYIEENTSNTFGERKNLWKRQASRKKERYIEPREKYRREEKMFWPSKAHCAIINFIPTKGKSEKEIRYAIDRRCERIDDDIEISLLEKPTNKIRIDRVLEQKGNSWGLVNTPELVLEKTRDHFCEQFREREVVLDEEVFEEFYRPLTKIKVEWYSDLEGEILEEEWLSTVREMKSNMAAGISEIGANSSHSRKVKWFEEVEKRIIKHQSMRIVDERFKVQVENVLSMKIYASKLSKDKRKHEWIVLNNKKEESFIGKVREKKKKKLLVKSWSVDKDKENRVLKDAEISIFKKGQDKSREDLFWVKRENLIGVVPKLGIKHNKKVPVIIKEIVGFKTENKEKELFKSETKMEDNIQVFSHEKYLIKQQGFERDEGAWKKLDDSNKVLLPKPDFKKIIFDATKKIRRSWRKSHIRELLINDMRKKCDKEFSSRKVKLSNKSLGEGSLLENGVKDNYFQRRKELVKSLFSQEVEDRIVNGVVPFWFGL